MSINVYDVFSFLIDQTTEQIWKLDLFGPWTTNQSIQLKHSFKNDFLPWESVPKINLVRKLLKIVNSLPYYIHTKCVERQGFKFKTKLELLECYSFGGEEGEPQMNSILFLKNKQETIFSK